MKLQVSQRLGVRPELQRLILGLRVLEDDDEIDSLAPPVEGRLWPLVRSHACSSSKQTNTPTHTNKPTNIRKEKKNNRARNPSTEQK
jgi:hypothetical protein